MTTSKTEPAGEDTAPAMSKEDRAKAITEIYTQATKTLRERHLAEFNQLRSDGAKARGIEWTPQPTAEEKAAAEVERLLAENPSLARRFGIENEGAGE